MAECSSIQIEDENPAIPMSSWEAEAVHDYGKVYARKYSDFRDDQATVWTSMYEKNLGRKVSKLPPWEVSQTGRKESSEKHFGDPTKKDFAEIHLERAAESPALGQKKYVPRGKKKVKKSRSGSDSSKEADHSDKTKKETARAPSLGEQDEQTINPE